MIGPAKATPTPRIRISSALIPPSRALEAGCACRATDSVVIRAGYGVNYNGAYARAVPFTQFWTFSGTLDINSSDGGFTPAFILSDGLPAVDPFTEEDRVGSFGATISGHRTVSPDFIQQNAYSQQWNFTLQKQLPDNIILEAQYQANVGRSLGGQNYNYNMIPVVGGAGPAKQSQNLRLFPQYNAVFVESPDWRKDWGNSTCHSLNSKVEQRFTSGLNYLFNYTWSKFIDDVESAIELRRRAEQRAHVSSCDISTRPFRATTSVMVWLLAVCTS